MKEWLEPDLLRLEEVTEGSDPIEHVGSLSAMRALGTVILPIL